MVISSDRLSTANSGRLLCILGMHRSGTSVTTQLLYRMGARVAPDLIAAINGVNDDGFWEDSRVVQLNEQLLQACGLYWYDFASRLVDGGGSVDTAIRTEATSHFIESYSGTDTWAVKDPRLCRLLPFWLEVWQRAELNPLFLHTVRHPYSVAKSLQRRDRIPCEYGVVLWLVHTLEAMSCSVGRPGMVVVFEEFLRQPLRLPQMLTLKHGVRFSVGEAYWQELADTTVKNTPQLFDTELDESPGLRELMEFSVSVYESLRASAYDSVDEALISSLMSDLHKLLFRYDDELRMLRRVALDLMALSAESVRIGDLHSRALAIIREKDHAIAERTQVIKDIAYFRFWRLVPRLMRRIYGQ